MPERYDVIIVGAGGVGSAALRQLARRGVRVLALEQHGIAHDYGSSHGETRIIRTAYFEHPDYVPLLRRAFTGWQELEAATRRQLLTLSGLLICGPAEGEAVPGALRAAREHSLPLEQLTPVEGRQRYPGYAFPADDCILYEPQAGYLRVEDCVRAQLDDALAHGGQLRTQEPVAGWTSDGRTARVWTDSSVYEAGALVLTAGAWAPQLLRSLGIELRVLRKVLLWFAATSSDPDPSACFYFERPEGAFYGFPSIDGATIKVAEHTGGDTVDDPALVDRLCHPADVTRVAAFVEQCLPRARPLALRHSVCLYTMSPDSHFLVDRHPAYPNVTFAAGLSGHGFKFTGVLGEALADLTLAGRTDLPIDFLKLSRFH